MADFDPADPLGVDLMAGDDLDANHRLVSGTQLLALDLYRRITTPRGRLIDDADYGIDVRSMLQKPMTVAEEATVPSRIRAEIVKDERVAAADVTVTRTDVNKWQIQILGRAGEAPFELVLDVTQASAVLLQAA